MATETDNIVIGQNGIIYVAPVGTAAPSDVSTAYAAGWSDVGWVSEDGATVTPGQDVEDIPAWQSNYPVMSLITGQTGTISFGALEWNQVTLPLAFGGGDLSTSTGINTYEAPTGSTLYERAVSIQWARGDATFRFVAPRVNVRELGEVALTRSAPATLSITLSVLAADGVSPWYILNDLAGLTVV